MEIFVWRLIFNNRTHSKNEWVLNNISQTMSVLKSKAEIYLKFRHYPQLKPSIKEATFYKNFTFFLKLIV
jgi:hypothetical protein